MSPEQALGYPDQIGPAADVYGLGATLYNILTRSTPIPFDPGEGVASVLSKVRRGEITPPRDANPDVPGVLEAICLKALALHPEERYPSAAAMKEDLWRWLAGRPVSVYRESLARRLIRRNRPRP
jgi:serine/threonine protein kinase